MEHSWKVLMAGPPPNLLMLKYKYKEGKVDEFLLFCYAYHTDTTGSFTPTRSGGAVWENLQPYLVLFVLSHIEFPLTLFLHWSLCVERFSTGSIILACQCCFTF